jgi:hypothetical protein
MCTRTTCRADDRLRRAYYHHLASMQAVAAHRGNQIATWRCDRIVHLELWDAIQDGHKLVEWREHPGYGEQLAAIVAALRDGSVRTASGFHFPAACRSVASVWLCGGDARIYACADRMALPTQIDPDGIFAAVRAGRELLAGEGMVVDLGQTSAKIWSTTCGRRRIERQERDFATLLAAALADEAPQSLVLAVPCEIFADALGPCSYFSRFSLADLSALVPCRTLLANDADLAAASALAVVEPTKYPMLVLTLGYGVGAALVLP